MAKKNCWEVKKCGREAGGAKASELGICHAATETRLNGTNDGKNAGRSCWGIAGTLCGGQKQGSFAAKMITCLECEFYKQVQDEEGKNMVGVKKILEKMK